MEIYIERSKQGVYKLSAALQSTSTRKGIAEIEH